MDHAGCALHHPARLQLLQNRSGFLRIEERHAAPGRRVNSDPLAVAAGFPKTGLKRCPEQQVQLGPAAVGWPESGALGPGRRRSLGICTGGVNAAFATPGHQLLRWRRSEVRQQPLRQHFAVGALPVGSPALPHPPES